MTNVFTKLASINQPLQALAGLLERSELADFAPRLREQYRTASDPAVHVVVMGAFNAGKSTFINALVGARVLPMGLIPTTAYVTRVGYSPQPEAVLRYADNRPPQTVNIEDLAEFLTIADSQKHAPLRQVEVLCPWRLAGRQELVLYDTPGFDDQAEQAMATRAALKRSDLTVFMLNARQPLTETEIEVATGWLEGSFPIFLVNFLNLIDEDDHDRILTRIRNGLTNHKLLFPDIPLAVVNVQEGLRGRLKNDNKLVERSGLAEFETILLDFASGSRRDKLLNATRWGRLQSLLGELYRANQAVLESASLKEAARAAAIQQQREQQRALAQRVTATAGSIEKIKSREIIALEFNLVRDLEHVVETAPLPALQNALQETVKNHLTEWLFQFEGLANQEWLKLRPEVDPQLPPLKFGQLAQQPLDVKVDYQPPTGSNQPNPANFNRERPLESLGSVAQDMGRQLGGFFGGLSGASRAEALQREQNARRSAAMAIAGLVARLCSRIEQGVAAEVQNRATGLTAQISRRPVKPPPNPPPSPQELLHRQIEAAILKLL